MTQLRDGEQVKLRYGEYTLDVEVTKVRAPDEYTGRVDEVFGTGAGPIAGGNILDLKGREIDFRSEDVVLRKAAR